MLYEIKFDNTKNIKLNENTFNCSIKIAILNRTYESGLIKEQRYKELKQNILQEYNLTPKQAEYIRNANRRWNFSVGAVRSGKSHIALQYA